MCATKRGKKDNVKAKVISHAAFADGYIKINKKELVGDSARPTAVRDSHGAEQIGGRSGRDGKSMG